MTRQTAPLRKRLLTASVSGGELLSVHDTEAVLHQQTGEYAASAGQPPGERAVIYASHPARRAPGLEHRQVYPLLAGLFQADLRSFPERFIHVLAAVVHDGISDDLAGAPGNAQAAGHLGTDGDEFVPPEERGRPFIEIVPSAVLALPPDQAGAHHDLHVRSSFRLLSAVHYITVPMETEAVV